MIYRLPLLITSFYLIAAPYLRISSLRFFDSQRILELTLFFFISLFLVLRKDRIKNISITSTLLMKPFVISITLLFSFGLISALFSEVPKYAFIEHLIYLLIVLLTILLSAKTLRGHFVLGKVIFITAVIYAVLYLIIFWGNYITSFLDPMIVLWPEKLNFTINYGGVEYKGRDILFFSHKRMFNHTQTWSLPLIIGLFALIKPKKENYLHRVLLFLLVSCWWLLVIASGARGTTISVTFALVILLVLWRKEVIKLFKTYTYTFLSGVFLYIMFYKLIPSNTAESPILRTSDSGRFDIWERALNLWLENPLFGVGPMHFAHVTSEPTFASQHNFYLQILSEWGIFAFVALLVMLIITIKYIYTNTNTVLKTSNEKNSLIYLSLLWSLLSATTHAFFSGIMISPMSQVWFIIILAWFLSYINRRHCSLIENNSFQYLKYIAFALIVCIVALAYNDILGLSEGYYKYVEEYPDKVLYPRFWDQGLFGLEKL